MPLTFCTSLDVFRSFFAKVGPPVVPFQEADRTINTWVAVDWWIMVDVTDALFSRLFLKSLSLDMIKAARDRGIVHMIVTRARTSLDRT